MILANKINLVLLGPPGAGKGTQAVLLKKAYGFLHISTGDMLREAIKEGTSAGKAAQGYMTKGELVPDEIVTRAVIGRMNKPDAESGVILDGYPRTRVQAESLDSSLKSENRSLNMVLYFRTSEKVAIQRLSGRRLCPKCGKNYHVTNMPSKIEGVCDICGVSLIQREDDNPETVKNRLVVYEDRTKDLIDYYEKSALLREVNGDLSAEELFEGIATLFKREGLVDDNSDE
ncbi:MAG: adenylate kinase [Candidatus Omnitrophota bacterium]|nr:adenylate kinase [Candidatus Omnitrophota bacterium]MBU1895077.1 adenylate kinase [Candidatus Omnitrophota bacterium]